MASKTFTITNAHLIECAREGRFGLAELLGGFPAEMRLQGFAHTSDAIQVTFADDEPGSAEPEVQP